MTMSPRSSHAERVRCGKLGGRPRRYDLSGLAVGKSVTLPWRVGFGGDRLAGQGAIHQAVRREARRLGQKFARIGRARGLTVTRIA